MSEPPHPPPDEPTRDPAASSGATPKERASEIEPGRLDPDALKVISRLRQFGHSAYLVGGCVRDALVGRTPKDFDICTSAHPGEIRSIFRNCRLIGRRFRLAHVYFKGAKIIEVSTFRANPAPPEAGEESADLLITEDNVFGTAEQDARRRDFTINGLFYDVNLGKVIDYVGGLADLRGKTVRTIGDPEIRMREDPVRILRAIRFAARLDFDIDPATYAAMEGTVEDLPRCAPARLLEETFRLLRSGASKRSIELLRALGALSILMPPVDAFMSASRDNEKALLAFLGGLDERTPPGRPHSDALLLAGLLHPLVETKVSSAEGEDPPLGEEEDISADGIERLLAEMVHSARMPRRTAETARLILRAQEVLSGERKRRRAILNLRRAPFFGDALLLFEVACAVRGTSTEMLDKWRSGKELEVAPSPEGPRKRRRRSRGRRRRAAPSQVPSPA
jgi:poly(A) polymerase